MNYQVVRTSRSTKEPLATSSSEFIKMQNIDIDIGTGDSMFPNKLRLLQ